MSSANPTIVDGAKLFPRVSDAELELVLMDYSSKLFLGVEHSEILRCLLDQERFKARQALIPIAEAYNDLKFRMEGLEK